MDLLKELVAQAKIKKIQIAVYQRQKLETYQKQKEQKQPERKKLLERKVRRL